MTIIDRACYERGCACYDDRIDKDGVEVMSIEAMKQALRCLDWMADSDSPAPTVSFAKAARDLRTAIEEAEKQEPVATVTSESGDPDVTMSWWHEPALPVGTKLYTTPPAAQRKWAGLTQQDIDIAFDDTQEGGGFNEFARAIEQCLKEKNT
jgi:hypothetical protein